jgi:hypothetical protein
MQAAAKTKEKKVKISGDKNSIILLIIFGII